MRPAPVGRDRRSAGGPSATTRPASTSSARSQRGGQVEVVGDQHQLLGEREQQVARSRGCCAGRAASSARRRPARRARSPAPRRARAAAAGRRRGRARCGRRARPARTWPAPRAPRGRRSRLVRGAGRRSDSATSSTTVGITSCAAGSVKQNATLRRTAAPSRADVEPVDQHLPGGGGDQAVEQPGEGRLARAVGARRARSAAR